MMEAALVIGNDGSVLHRHLPPGRSGGSLPDSRGLWDVIWEKRDRLWGIAHSHPGSGLSGPSHTDVTTFAAVEAALGRRLFWWITSSDTLALVVWGGPAKHDYEWSKYGVNMFRYESWVRELREISAYYLGEEAEHG